jgi:hypothetical protein
MFAPTQFRKFPGQLKSSASQGLPSQKSHAQLRWLATYRNQADREKRADRRKQIARGCLFLLHDALRLQLNRFTLTKVTIIIAVIILYRREAGIFR